MKKWVFLILWIISLLTFFIGQIIVPPNYANLPSGSNWGEFFGITVISGIVFFILMVYSFVFGKKKTQEESDKNAS